MPNSLRLTDNSPLTTTLFGQPKSVAQLKVGDKIVVAKSYTPTVKRITFDPSIQRTQIDLDWGVNGKSKVYMDDEGKSWIRLEHFN